MLNVWRRSSLAALCLLTAVTIVPGAALAKNASHAKKVAAAAAATPAAEGSTTCSDCPAGKCGAECKAKGKHGKGHRHGKDCPCKKGKKAGAAS